MERIASAKARTFNSEKSGSGRRGGTEGPEETAQTAAVFWLADGPRRRNTPMRQCAGPA